MKKTLLISSAVIMNVVIAIGTEALGDKPVQTDLATLGVKGNQPLTADTSGLFKHVIVYKQPRRFCGWPNNHGMWSWDNEILVGFCLGHYKVNKDWHDMDRDKPRQAVKARSLDGGETWKMERPRAFRTLYQQKDRKQPQCPIQINFMHPDFAMAGHSSFFYFSYNRGKTWKGPYTLSTFGQKSITMGARNDYIVNDQHDCLLSITTSKRTDRKHGRALCARTTDGGQTWNFVSWMAPEPTGHSTMPSTVRCSKNRLVSAIRRKEKRKRGGFLFFIEVYSSNDNGKTWEFLSKVANTGRGNGNPASMIRLNDGRIVVTYGYRAKPYGIRAKISSDDGKTWGPEIHLRDDGRSWDLGYPQTVQRPDGKIVTVYYFTTEENPQQHIAATIWDPDKISSKISEKDKETTLSALQEATNKQAATLGVQARWPVAVKAMSEKARVYINRKDNFTQIPEFLQGLQYTLHHRTRIINFSCRVKTPGRIYLCLFGDKTPKSIGLHGNWGKCRTMRGPSFRGKNDWTIYQAYVQAGEIVTVSRDDNMGITVVAKEITKDKTRPLPKMPVITNAKKYTAGKSVEKRPIEYLVFGEGNDVVFILATIHGDEYVGTPLVHRLAEYLDEHPDLLNGRKVVLLPNANPDGMAHFDHFNVNGVDLNRNFDSSNRRNGGRAGRRALSEPEARVIYKIIEKYSPDRIVSIHQMMGWTTSSKKPPGMIDHDGPGEALARHMARYCKLPAERFGTQHGSLGAYVGEMLDIPIITLELLKFDYGLNLEQLWEKYGTALIAAIVYPDKVKLNEMK